MKTSFYFASALAALGLLGTLPVVKAQTPTGGKSSGTSTKTQASLWKALEVTALSDPDTHPYLSKLNAYRAFSVDGTGLRQALRSAPLEFTVAAPQSPATLSLPTPTGRTFTFRFVESPILSPELAAKNPDIKTYSGQCVEDPTMSTRFDVTRTGFHAMVYSPKGNYFINPYRDGDGGRALAFYESDIQRTAGAWKCVDAAPAAQLARGIGTQGVHITPQYVSGTQLRTYRLALSCSGEYAQAVCSPSTATVSLTQSKMVTTINRVDGIFEIDTCIRLNLVQFNIYLDGNTDPFTNDDGGTMLGENQSVCDASPGSANYDIGHVFSTGGGGVAYRPCVCVDGLKAGGVTGSPDPFGDGFDVDYVIHEMGHQFSGDHTFNGEQGACGGGNRASNAAYEPGSGSTIMAYAGICGSDDLQPHSDPYFQAKSLEQILSYRDAGGACGLASNTGNNVPTLNVGPAYTIPLSTPFTMTATGTDPDGDTLTYCWEQYNLGSTNAATNTASGVLFRSFNPTISGSRSFPQLSSLLLNAATPREVLPTVNRTIAFRCTVRDNRAGGGGVRSGDVTITANGAAFSLTGRTTAFTWTAGSATTINWTVGATTATAKLDVLFSSDNGTTFTVLQANVPNTGSAVITAPNTATVNGRVLLRAVGNIFFDVSRVPGKVKLNAPTLSTLSPATGSVGGNQFTLTVTGTNFYPQSIVRWNGTNRTTTSISPTQLTAVIPAADLTSAGTASVTVFNSALGGGGGTSNALTFTIAQTYSLSGTITLQSCAAPSGRPITLQFRPVGGGTNINATATLTSGGAYTVTGIPAGNYNVAIKGTKWLQKVAAANLSSGSVSNVNVTLLAGDVNNNNKVDVDDLTLLLNVYNSTLGDGTYTDAADLTCNGKVDVDDLTVLLNNYNTTGTP